MAIRIGCGSWTDDDYVGLLFPKGLAKTSRLQTYAQWFERIELNSSYYNTPSPRIVAGWAAQTPPDFLFDVKLHRDFSDDPKLAATGVIVSRFVDAIRPLAETKKLGAFLLTLSPGFGPKHHRLDELDGVAEKLQPYAPVAVELRDRGWVEGDALASTLAYFRERKFAWVALDLPPIDARPILPPIDEVTLPGFAYMRLHGRNPDYLKRSGGASARHNYDYPAAELDEIAARIRALATKARNVHVSANNHYSNFAPKAALALRRLLGQAVPPPLKARDENGQLSLLD